MRVRLKSGEIKQLLFALSKYDVFTEHQHPVSN